MACRTASTTSRSQLQPVGAVFVTPLVGEARQELPEQREGAGVDLDPVESGDDGAPGRRSKGGDDLPDPARSNAAGGSRDTFVSSGARPPRRRRASARLAQQLADAANPFLQISVAQGA